MSTDFGKLSIQRSFTVNGMPILSIYHYQMMITHPTEVQTTHYIF